MENTFVPLDKQPAHLVSPAICWKAILAGAVAAASLSLILFILGSGLGLTTLSPWTPGPSPIKLSVAIVSWLIIMQWISSAVGGYFAGRLRKKYIAVHTDEAFFRDTAHGFLAWAVATLFIAVISVSAVSSVISGGAHAMGTAAMLAPKPGMEKPMGPMGGPANGPAEANMYLVDTLFRSSHPTNANAAIDDHEVRAETTRILLTGLKNDDVPQADKTYLAQVVAARANISQAEASKRVDDAIAQMQTDKEKAKEAADSARKTAATLAIFIFLSMLIGAFIGSVTGALGGKCRDEFCA